MKKLIAIAVLLFIFVLPVQIYGRESNPLSPTVIKQLNTYIENEPNLQGAITGISIRSSKTGEILYDHFGGVRLRPASTLKLLTAAAALSTLGGNYQFSTEIRTNGSVKQNTLHGNLYIKGKGDPTVLSKDMKGFAKFLKQKGIHKIIGDIVVDDSWYDTTRYSLDLPWSDETTYYGAQVSALTVSPDNDYDTGTVIIEVRPGQKIGQMANIKVHPNTKYIMIENQAVTVSPEGTKDLTIKREHGNNTIFISGTIPLKSTKEREWVSVWEPSGLFLDLFQRALHEQGIQSTGKATSGATPRHTQLLLTRSSIPLSKILTPYMKLSNNGHAEILVKEMGKVFKGVGSWEKGLSVVGEQLPTLGVNPTTIVMRDGSGVSHVDAIPANEITSLLYTAQGKPWFPTFKQSLPVSGEKGKMTGGTLRTRLQENGLKGRVRAKTGTLSTVSSLAGYLERKNGDTLIFAILINNLLDEEKGKEVENHIVRILNNRN